MIYLDYSANTPADPEVLRCLAETETRFPGNPNSDHAAGRAAREEMARVTEEAARLLGVLPSEVLFNSGASEGNNTAVKGLAQLSKGRHIVSTPLEHASVSGCLEVLKGQGYEIDLVNVGPDGKIDLSHLQSLLRPDTALVAVAAVDSELGAVQPLAEISALLRDFPNCRLHVDATQAVGKIPLSLEGADTATLSAHKFYGPGGCGILFKARGLDLPPLIHGGASATPYRSGTPALGLAAAQTKALSLATERFAERLATVSAHNRELRRFFAAFPRVRINSPADAVPHILNLSVEGVRGPAFQSALDREGVCVSVKSACSSDGAPSRAVLAVTGDRRNALSSWRISLSHRTTPQELREFEERFARCYQTLASR